MTMPHATITDARALSEISCESIEAYLTRHGWKREGKHDWKKQHGYVRTPLDHEIGTLVGNVVVGRMLAYLASLENRSQLDIYADIMGFRWVRLDLTPRRVDPLPYPIDDEEQPE